MPREVGIRDRPASGRLFHRAGPPETESADTAVGHRIVQRCLRCDNELVVILEIDGSRGEELTVGRRVPLGDDGLRCPGRLPER